MICSVPNEYRGVYFVIRTSLVSGRSVRVWSAETIGRAPVHVVAYGVSKVEAENRFRASVDKHWRSVGKGKCRGVLLRWFTLFGGKRL